MTIKNLQQFKLVEKIKIAYLKTRGNVVAISEELNLPLDYVQKAVKKFKKQESRDVAVLISNNLMTHIMFGYESRVTNMMAMLKTLDGRDQYLVSMCCDAPVRRIEDSKEYGYEDYTCVACHQICETRILDKESIVDLKIKLLKELREEDKSLVDFAGKMGYTNTEPLPPEPTVINKNNILVIKNDKQQQIVEDYNKLHPMDKERLVEKLRKEIVNIDEQIEAAEKDEAGRGDVLP